MDLEALKREAVRAALKDLARRLVADVEPAEGDEYEFERGYHAAGQVVLDAIKALGPEKEA